MRLNAKCFGGLVLLAAMTSSVGGCGGGNFNSSGDPYSGAGNADDEQEAVQADLAKQQEAYNPH